MAIQNPRNTMLGRHCFIQQPKSDNGPDDVVSGTVALVMAKVVGSVMTVVGIVAFPTHGDAEGLFGVGTRICGLWPDPPAVVEVDGIVASMYAGPVMVARPGIVTATLLPNASIMARVLAAGSQAPVMIDVPKEEVAGTVAPGRIGGGSVPLIGSAVVALNRVGAAVPLVGHDVILPTVLPEIRPKAPVLIVPSAACWAKVELQPNATMAAVMKTKLRIGASLRLTHRDRYR